MLFGPCNCPLASSGPSRRGLLCAGGAGFVTALLGTLIGSGRTTQAKTVSGSVPAVDRVNVTIVDDIMVRRGALTEKLDGLTVERAAPNEVPDRPPHETLVGEWGLSMHAESYRGDEVRRIMVDFGYNPVTLLNNMEILKIAPETLDALVLSHGHYDHFGGLVGFLSDAKAGSKTGCPSSSAAKTVSARACILMAASMARSIARRLWMPTCYS